jgi:hypothetical protein
VPEPAAPPPPAALSTSAPAGATRFDRRREHEPEPVVEQPPTPWVTIVLCATIVFALGAGAAGIGAASASKPSAPPRTGSFTLVPGATWQPAPIGRAPQMQFDSPVVFKLRPPAEALASVGVIAKQGPPGNPLAGEPLRSFEREPTPALVRVGRRTMVRYRGALREGGVATVFVLPTTKGALAAACSQPQAEARCAALVATAGLGRARALAPQPPEEAVTTVVDAIHRLEQARGIGAIKLNPLQKQGRDESAQAASTLAGAYQEAAQALELEQGDAGTRAQIERVSRAALDASFAFEQLSGAIDTDDPVSYSAARSEALQADRALARALARLARSGYGVREG